MCGPGLLRVPAGKYKTTMERHKTTMKMAVRAVSASSSVAFGAGAGDVRACRVERTQTKPAIASPKKKAIGIRILNQISGSGNSWYGLGGLSGDKGRGHVRRCAAAQLHPSRKN